MKEKQERIEQKSFIVGEIKEINGKMAVVASDETKDRHGEVIKAGGWELANFKKNPVMLIGHDYGSLPVGKWVNPRIEKNSLIVEPEFAKTDRGLEVQELVEAGILPAVSVGFMVKERDSEDQDIITKAELLEISWVSVPANPNALMRAIEKGYSFSMEKSEEMKKKDDLLKYYKGIIKEYRKMVKEIREKLEIEINEEGEEVPEKKQISIIQNHIVKTFEDLISKSEAVNQQEEQKQQENPSESAEEVLKALMPIVMEEVKKELKKFI